jgi:hypothetical protein
MAWLGRPRTNPDAYSLAAATGLLAALAWATRRFRLVPTAAFAFVVLAGAGATVGASSCARAASAPRRLLFADRLWGPSRVRSKDPEGFFGLFEHVGKDRGLRPWMLERIEPGYDVLVLPAPTEPLSAADLGVVDETLRAGRTVAWLATEESLRAPGGRQLAKRFGVEARLIPRPDSSSMGEARIHGTTRLHRGVSTLRLPPRVDLVRISARGSRVRLRLHAGESKGDFVTEIPSRGGRFVVVTPAEVFANANLHDRQTRLGMVDLVVQIFRWMTETR